jgi:hypothetical protein
MRGRGATRPAGISMDYSAARSLLLRFLVYAALIAGTFEWIVLSVQSRGSKWLVHDDGPLEIAQFLAALCTALLFWLLSRERRHSAELLRFFAALSLIACARELDNFTLERGSRDAYKYLAMAPLAWALWQLGRARLAIVDQAAAFARTSGFSLLLAGFLVVVVYSQILGQKELWMAVLDPSIYRPVKDLVEESSEMLGYLLMLFGAAESAVAGAADDRRE